MNNRHAAFLAATLSAACVLSSTPADACGGCFIPPATESTVVTGHRMALSVSPAQSVLWDQIEYAGDPAEFSWVLPVKKGARIEAANDAFFDVLDAATGVTVVSPFEGCGSSGSSGGFGCGSGTSLDSPAAFAEDGGQNSGVKVVHKGTVGPYETVTLEATDPNALNDWLEQHGYSVPDNIQPVIDAYVAEGFDFIAIKLVPGKGVEAMKPVRVVSPGASYALPLRMVAAGVGSSVGIVLFVIGEGRYEAADYKNGHIPPELVTWDFKPDRSDFSDLRAGLLSSNGGRTWLTAYSKKGSLLSPIADPIGFNTLTYSAGNSQASTIAQAYVMQGIANNEGNDSSCLQALENAAGSMAIVVDTCDESGENCAPAQSGQLAAHTLKCGTLDDVGVALTGLHPRDVTITRLEASLPVAALDADLKLEAAADQAQVENRFVAALKVNACWDQQPSVIGPLRFGDRPRPFGPGEIVVLGLGAAALLLAARRRTAMA